MNEIQRKGLQWHIDYANNRIAEVAASCDHTLNEKRFRYDCQMIMLFAEVIKVLPKQEREAIQACYDAYKQVWDGPSIPTLRENEQSGVPVR